MHKKTTRALNERQKEVAAIVAAHHPISSTSILSFLSKKFAVSQITIKRDLAILEKQLLATHQGLARARKYLPTPQYTLTTPIRVDEYFAHERPADTIATRFNHKIFQLLSIAPIFLPDETDRLNRITATAQRYEQKISPTIRAHELERFIIEFSWKSSRIEGNTYTLLETENLIKRHQRAQHRNEKEAQMILNHKEALSFILKHPQTFHTLTVATIEKIHELLVRDLEIPRNIRASAVGITGTHYRPLDNQFQIREALEESCTIINTLSDPFAKAIIIMLLLAYIQPFEDGNKRTSRMLGNALLLAYKKLPLSYRATEEGEYKKAVILFYEKNNLSYFKKLFMDQYEFVAQNYFAEKNPHIPSA